MRRLYLFLSVLVAIVSIPSIANAQRLSSRAIQSLENLLDASGNTRLRLDNGQYLKWRNAANTVDLDTLIVTNANNTHLYGFADVRVICGQSGAGNILLKGEIGSNVGIMLDIPTARLHLPAGTATANTAPLKFTAGTLLNPAALEAGAMEYDTATQDLWFTNTTNRYGIISHITDASDPHGATLTQTNLALTGTFDISNANPILTLTDTDVTSADLQVDVNANIAQIRAVGGAANSLISLNLSRNSIGIGIVPGTTGELLNLSKIATDPTIDVVPMGISSVLRYSGATTLGFMYGLLQNINKEGAGSVTNMLGINCYATGNTGGGTITNLAIFNSDCSVVSGTTITRAQHFHVTPTTGTGTVTSEAGFQCPTLTKGTNRVGFVYGLADGTLPTGVFAIYADTDPSYFGANVAIGATAFGASAAKVLGILNGTAPTTSPVDMIQIFSADNTEVTPGATLGLRTENAPEAIGTFTESHKLRIWVNGVEYWISLDAV